MNKDVKIPTLTDLVTQSPESLKQNALMVLLNQDPPKEWLVKHPMISNYMYLPIERVEFILTQVYERWWVEVKSIQTIANSVVVSVRLYVVNKLTNQIEWNDGIGAAPIQTDKGAGATDWNAVKTDGVQKAAPAAETYAVKDAAEKFGKIFGKDISRKVQLDYTELLAPENDLRDDLNPNHELWDAIKTAIKEGKRTIQQIESKFKLSPENKALLLNAK